MNSVALIVRGLVFIMKMISDDQSSDQSFQDNLSRIIDRTCLFKKDHRSDQAVIGEPDGNVVAAQASEQFKNRVQVIDVHRHPWLGRAAAELVSHGTKRTEVRVDLALDPLHSRRRVVKRDVKHSDAAFRYKTTGK